MDAAMPLEPDPFAALTQRFAAFDAKQEEQHQRGEEVLKNGKAAMKRLKETAARTVTGDTPTKTRLCIKAFAESDLDRVENIEEAAASVQEEAARVPITEVLDPEQVLARLNAAREEAGESTAASD